MTHGSRRILVLDDSPSYLDFMRTLLESEGFAVVTAATHSEAQRRLREAQFDLVITDALMPGSAPFAMLDLLQQDPDTAGLPVVLCSGAIGELSAQHDRLEHQGVAVVAKPFDIDTLLACVTTRLQPQRAQLG